MVPPVNRRLVVLMGLPGSGKTTLAAWLERHTDIVTVSRDAIRAAMFPHCSYTLDEKRAAYAAMKAALGITLRQGLAVCTDGITFASQEDRDDMAAIASASGAPVLWVWCDVPIPIAQERVAQDTVTVFADRTPALVTEVAARFAPVPADVLRMDMTNSVETIGARLLEALDS